MLFIQPLFTQTSTPHSNGPVPVPAVGSKASYEEHENYEKISGGFFTFTSIDEFHLRETSMEICASAITGEIHVRPITPRHGGEKTNVQVHLLLSNSNPNPTSSLPEIETMQTKSGIAIRRTNTCEEDLNIIATIWISPGTSLMRHLSIITATHSLLPIIFHQDDNNTHFALVTSTNFHPSPPPTFIPLSRPRQTDSANMENTTPDAPSKT